MLVSWAVIALPFVLAAPLNNTEVPDAAGNKTDTPNVAGNNTEVPDAASSNKTDDADAPVSANTTELPDTPDSPPLPDPTESPWDQCQTVAAFQVRLDDDESKENQFYIYRCNRREGGKDKWGSLDGEVLFWSWEQARETECELLDKCTDDPTKLRPYQVGPEHESPWEQ